MKDNAKIFSLHKLAVSSVNVEELSDRITKPIMEISFFMNAEVFPSGQQQLIKCSDIHKR